MKTQRRLALLLVLTLTLTVLSGCVSKAKTGNEIIDNLKPQELGETLVRALDEMSNFKTQAEDLQTQVDELSKLVQGVQMADPEFPAVDKVEDDTGRTTFKKPNDYIRLPDPMRVPGDVPAAVDNKIAMGGVQGITLDMAPIWSYRIEGNKLWLSTVSGVYGVIVIGKMQGNLNMALLDTIFD